MSANLSYIGNNFVVGLHSSKLSSQEKQLLKTLKPSGIIIFSHNIDSASSDWPIKLRALIDSAQESAQRDSFIVSIDHEGDKVHRLPLPATRFPAAREWKHCSREVGRAMACELRALSINLNFAPVLDIHCEEKNTVIGNRAFSDDAKIIIEHAKEFIAGLESEGVLACAKHFPGHGATLADSHFELPVLNEPLEVLRDRELKPFKEIIKNGIQLIMTAHVLYPCLDPKNPATVSKAIMHDLLRNELNFSGTIISDALEMKALNDIPKKDVAIESLIAGVDILLVATPCNNQPPLLLASELAQNITNALEGNLLDETLIRNSHKRIDKLICYVQSLTDNAQKTNYPLSLLGDISHRKLADKIESES